MLFIMFPPKFLRLTVDGTSGNAAGSIALQLFNEIQIAYKLIRIYANSKSTDIDLKNPKMQNLDFASNNIELIVYERM